MTPIYIGEAYIVVTYGSQEHNHVKACLSVTSPDKPPRNCEGLETGAYLPDTGTTLIRAITFCWKFDVMAEDCNPS